jgi:hypothetical protein
MERLALKFGIDPPVPGSASQGRSDPLGPGEAETNAIDVRTSLDGTSIK